MSQITHNISNADDGLGDKLRTAFDHQNAMNTELYTDKVDKVTGKDLSENDFTDALKTKLDGIEIGAKVNVQADWLQNDNTQDDYIKNRPVIVDGANRIISQTGFSLVADEFTVNANWSWEIYGSNFTNVADEVLIIPFCATGLTRIDYIVPNTINTFDRIQGDEVVSDPFAPILPNGGIYVSYFIVTDSTISTPSNPLLDYSRYKGKYNATTNTPALANGIGDNGDYYQIAVAGTQDFGDGNIVLSINDWLHYNGIDGIWQKFINNNQIGVATVTAGTNITITGTSTNPIINASGGASGVLTVTAGTNVTVTGTSTDPIINATTLVDASAIVAGKVSIGTQSFAGNKTIIGSSSTVGNAFEVQNLANSVVAQISNSGDSYFNGVKIGTGKGNITTNTALGLLALDANTSGAYNVAVGRWSLKANTVGGFNVGIGGNTLLGNTSGNSNLAIGTSALQVNSSGSFNVAVGGNSLQANTTAINNVGIGSNSLQANTTGGSNTGVGFASLFNSTTASNNVAIGEGSLRQITTGGNNVGIGFEAGRYTTAGGSNALGSSSVFIGHNSRAAADNETNQIVIGSGAIGLGNNTATIGNTSITKTVLRGVIAHSTSYTVATLPTGILGDTAHVTDAVSPTYLGALTGGGSVVCPVFFNGTIWVSH